MSGYVLVRQGPLGEGVRKPQLNENTLTVSIRSSQVGALFHAGEVDDSGGSSSIRISISTILTQIQGEISRDKLKGTNGAKFAVFLRADFRRSLQIFAFPGNCSTSEVQIFADIGNRRCSQKIAGKSRFFVETRLSH